MVVSLHNLSARVASLSDLRAVTELMTACDLAESGIADPEQKDVWKAWHASGFNLKTDAWIVVTNDGLLVGYADVRCNEHGQWTFLLRVHPDYQARGIGVLLIWLVEKRMRQLITHACPKVMLSSVISSMDRATSHLLERDGYTLVRSFWRLAIEMDEVPFDEIDHGSELIVIDSQNLVGMTPLQKRTGMYVARQYRVYEKELQVMEEIHITEDVEAQPLMI